MRNGHKTIFITSFHPHISRNILSTDVLRFLKNDPNLRIILTVPDYKADYFKKHFGADNVLVEGFKPYLSSRTFAGLFFKRLSRNLLDTNTARYKRRFRFYWDKNFFNFAFLELASFLGRAKAAHALARRLDLQLSPSGIFDGLISTYKPCAVFSTDLHNENDVALMQDAKRQKIPIIGMWRSWDNPAQQILRVFPDLLLLGSEELKKETIDLHGYPEEQIKIVGIPHYDKYIKGPTKSRSDFFSGFKLNLAKKLIFFAPGGDKIIKVNDLDDHVLKILAGLDANILVRFPPGEDINSIDTRTWPGNVHMDKPGFRFAEKIREFEITPEDDENLINSLQYADIVVTGNTSLPLDATLARKPSILAEVYPTERNIYEKSWGYMQNHINKLWKSGGTWCVWSREELLSAIDSYLKNPSLHEKGRAKIRSMWLSCADGKSGARTAEAILNFLNK